MLTAEWHFAWRAVQDVWIAPIAAIADVVSGRSTSRRPSASTINIDA
jgi:hypothetical protein